MVRKILFALLALGPLVVVLDHAGLGEIQLFVLAALALIPLAWLIGEATEHAAHHTGPGIGGFLNATFGNAPELIIALFAVHDGLTEVVRGSLTGSVVGNLLLVLGFSLAFGGSGELDRRSSMISLGLVAFAVLLFLMQYSRGSRTISSCVTVQATDEIGIATGIEFHMKSQSIPAGPAGLRLTLQHKLGEVRPELIRIHIEDAKLVDVVRRIVEVLCVRAFEIPVKT